jgi:alkanesulfonate monooxygenase SsuD/methylene tetrahydromethanopterin reductase-like flavin-dependent oxidoreductase (luciferase family)
MRYGLTLPTGYACAAPLLLAELARVAESAGWDAVFVEDYVVYQGKAGIPTCDSWVALTAMALATQHIRLGTMVTPLPRRRPWKVAREAVTLDQLSGGRLILGVGSGDSGDLSFQEFGEEASPRSRAAMLDEGLEVMAGMWSGRPFSYDRTHYHVAEDTFLPTPIQTPRIPVWVGGAYPSRGPLRRAAHWDGAALFKPNGDWTPADLLALKAAVEADHPLPPAFDIVVGPQERSADTDEKHAWMQALADAGATWWVEWIPPGEPGHMRAEVERGPLRLG